MKKHYFSFSTIRTLLVPLALLPAINTAGAGNDECKAVGEYGFVCGRSACLPVFEKSRLEFSFTVDLYIWGLVNSKNPNDTENRL